MIFVLLYCCIVVLLSVLKRNTGECLVFCVWFLEHIDNQYLSKHGTQKTKHLQILIYQAARMRVSLSDFKQLVRVKDPMNDACRV